MIVPFVLVTALSVLVSVAGGYHDWIILDKGEGKIPELAKWIGNVIELLAVTFFAFWLKGSMDSVDHIFLLLIGWTEWWITHDMTLGYKLAGSVWHIGNTGFDEKMLEMFQQSPKLYAGVRFGLLGLWIISYFSFQIILHI